MEIRNISVEVSLEGFSPNERIVTMADLDEDEGEVLI